jgi:hypothetical protein
LLRVTHWRKTTVVRCEEVGTLLNQELCDLHSVASSCPVQRRGSCAVWNVNLLRNIGSRLRQT